MYIDAINTIWVGKIKYKSEERTTKHSHDFFQLIFVVSGQGNLIIRDSGYYLKEGELFLCPPYYEHDIISDRTHLLRTIEVKFYIRNQDMLKELEHTHGSIELKEAGNILENSIEEARKENYFSQDFLNINIFTLLLKILSRQNYPRKEDSTFDYDVIPNFNYKGIDFGKLFIYIHKNISMQITLEELSKLVGFDATYLCRVFKSKYGFPPIQYVNNLRLKKARELLKNSEYSITEIADKLGFQSVHYFSRYFKKKERMSPLEYKKMSSENFFAKFEKNYIIYNIVDNIRP